METKTKKYHQYNDYIFKQTLYKYANGVLKFLNIPYKINNIILSELTDFGPQIHRIDFAGEATKDSEEILLILECQTRLPNDDDITRFFQYVSSMRVFKNRKVELYILCTKKAPYTKKEYVINDNCIYTMNVISLKDFRGEEILKNVENKIKNNNKITSEDIACLQLIAYTSYDMPTLELLKNAVNLTMKLKIKRNEKLAINYILDVLSANMLEGEEKEKFLEETKMMINPREEYWKKQGIQEGIIKGKQEGKLEGKQEGIQEGKLEIAKNLLKEDIPLTKICKITGLTEKQIKKTQTKYS